MGELQELTGREVVEVLRERYADLARAREALLEAVWETALRDDPDTAHRMSDLDDWSADEVRAALGLTRKAATALVSQARDAFHRLPALPEAMARGDLDEPRARVLADWTTELSDVHANEVVEALLPKCQLSEPTCLTTGQLIEQIKTMAIALDPNWAQRRYENALAGRRVIASRNPDGTATISGQHQPVERVAASVERGNKLARAAKRLGDRRPIDHIRSEFFLSSLDGTYEGLDEAQIVKLLAATGGVGVDETAAQASTNDPTPEPTPEAPAPEPTGAPEPTRTPGPTWAGVGLRVRLTTLLGLDRFPAEISGWGTVHAELAVQLVGQLGAAQWRYTFTDAGGYFLRTGLTNARPVGSAKRAASCQGTVEIVVPAGLLPKPVHAGLDPAWQPVLSDLYAKLTDPVTVRRLDKRRRTPGAALRREVIASIKDCVGVGCRAPAASTDIDHLKDHAKGGDTVRENLDPNCRHDHRVKTEAGWRLRRVDDTFEWTTRLGHVYLVPVPPVLPRLTDEPEGQARLSRLRRESGAGPDDDPIPF